MHKEKTAFKLGVCKSDCSMASIGRVQKTLKKKHPALSFETEFFSSTKGLGKALKNHDIDFAIYSGERLPAHDSAGFTTAAALKREGCAEVLLSQEGYTLESLPEGAKVATMTARQKGQLLFARKDLHVKLVSEESSIDEFDAVVISIDEARRRDCEELISEFIGYDFMLPYPAQGVVAIQCREERALLEIIAVLNDEKTLLAALGERSYLAGLGNGTDLPVAAFGQVSRKMLTLAGAVVAVDGSEKHLLQVTIDLPSDVQEARKTVAALGQKLARVALEDGAAKLLNQHTN